MFKWIRKCRVNPNNGTDKAVTSPLKNVCNIKPPGVESID
jgi:hypothetical protein